ncbi:DMT family transporter [Aldersonia sp. NBC_00410]|uniref:DMT family transporter n=1 Tax=Aldersonia sp. NBC_00410 TaxID=2975954 RepID=UPI0022572B8F|nr:DMT family transporter [Aldersonia sp. NBC_00410]MCX5043740.1 DMT family transporter [Aldersonia sp. NBC_00410]
MIIVLALGLGAAFLFALAAWYQQRAARSAVHSDLTSGREIPRATALIRVLLRSRTWLIGWVINLCGFLTQAIALHFGSVAAVQPLMSTQLLFALPLSAAEQRRWPTRRDWCAGVLVCGGLVLLLTVGDAAPLSGDPHRNRVLLATVSAIGLIAVLLALSRRASLRTASMLIAVGAGVCFAMSAVFMKLTIDDLVNAGVTATAVDWPGYALAGSTLAGLLLEQQAFASGTLPSAVAAMSVTNPVVSLTIGLMAFDVPAPTAPGALAAIAASGVLIALGITGLANSPSMQAMYGSGAAATPSGRVPPQGMSSRNTAAAPKR